MGRERRDGAKRRSDRTKPTGRCAVRHGRFQVLFAFGSEISNREQPWEYCWNDANSVSFALEDRRMSRNANSYRSVPDRFGDFSQPFRCAKEFSDECYLAVSTENIKRVYTFGLGKVSKLRTVIGLNDFGHISEENYGTPYKINRGIAAVFFISVNKTLPCRFLDHCVLIEFLAVFADITNSWNKFHIHLPFDTNHSRCIVRLVMQRLFLCGFCLFAKAETHKHTIKRSGMARIFLILTQFTV